MKASPERGGLLARAAAGGSPPASGTRSGGRTRTGHAAWGVSSPPQAQPVDAEFERRQLHDLPRDIRVRLLEGAPLAADQPITGTTHLVYAMADLLPFCFASSLPSPVAALLSWYDEQQMWFACEVV